MDTRVPADDAGWPSTPAAGRPDAIERRLAAIERRLDGLEGSLREAIAEDLAVVGEDLRRTVSDLGRLLLRDLDRLTRVLADHRDAIVDRLQSQPAGAPPAASVPVAAALPAPEAVTSDAEEATASKTRPGEEGRWHVLPGRRRRPRPPAPPAAG